MQTKKRQKICYNCNAQVDLEVIVCPYCGTDLLEEFESEYTSDEDLDSKALSPQQTIASLYPPPYQGYDSDEDEIESDNEEEEESVEDNKQERGFISVVALTLSLNLIGITLLLFFFSEKGEINLYIDNKYLIFLFAAAFPILLWGWKDLKEE